MKKAPEQMLEALQDGRAILTVKQRHGRGRALVEIVNQGVRYEMTLTLTPLPGKEQASMKTYRSEPLWTVEDLMSRGLPLYWSKTWLETQLSVSTVARLELITGYPRETLAVWIQRHKIPRDARRIAVREAWESGVYRTKTQLAAAYDISMPTLNRYLKAQ